MKRKSLLSISLLLGILLTSSSFAQYFQTAKTPEEVGFSAERLKRIDALLQSFVDDGLAPNAVTFVARKGKIVHFKTFGYRNVEKKTPLKKDDIFRIASQTKLLTTISMMMLYEEGKCLMTDPVSKYIPAFKNPKVLEDFDKETLTYTTRPAKREITIHDLLTHTAGIPYQHPLEKLPEFQIPYLNSLKAETLADVVPKIAARPLLNDPGEKFVYGLNADVAGYLVEILSGQSLADFFKNRIFDPLEMKDTYFYLPPNKASRLVPLYAKPEADDPMALSDNDANSNFATTGAQTYYAGGAPKEDLIMLVYTNIHPYAHYGDFVRKFRVAVYQSVIE